MSKSVGRSKATKKTRKNSQDEDSDLDIDLDLDDEDLDLDEEDLDLDEEDLDLDLDDEDLNKGKRKKKDPSMSKEINKMINGTIKDIKDGNMAVPAIGIGMIALIGFAIYKKANI